MQNTSQIQQDSLKFLKINHAQVLLFTGEGAGGKATESKSNSSFVQNKYCNINTNISKNNTLTQPL